MLPSLLQAGKDPALSGSSCCVTLPPLNRDGRCAAEPGRVRDAEMCSLVLGTLSVVRRNAALPEMRPVRLSLVWESMHPFTPQNQCALLVTLQTVC